MYAQMNNREGDAQYTWGGERLMRIKVDIN